MKKTDSSNWRSVLYHCIIKLRGPVKLSRKLKLPMLRPSGEDSFSTPPQARLENESAGPHFLEIQRIPRLLTYYSTTYITTFSLMQINRFFYFCLFSGFLSLCTYYRQLGKNLIKKPLFHPKERFCIQKLRQSSCPFGPVTLRPILIEWFAFSAVFT